MAMSYEIFTWFGFRCSQDHRRMNVQSLQNSYKLWFPLLHKTELTFANPLLTKWDHEKIYDYSFLSR